MLNHLFNIIFAYLFLTGICVGYTRAQNSVPPATGGYWLSYSGDNKINSKFGIHSEAQVRNIFIKESVSTKLVRVGIHHYIRPHVMVTAGYVFLHNNPNSDYLAASKVTENRLWQQLIIRQRSQVIFMEHRYRLEQRFISNKTTFTSRTDHRIRYRFQTIFPLYTITAHLRHWFLVANNEIMINFKKDPSLLFDRNRFFAGVGYQVRPNLNFQLAYMNQYALVPRNMSSLSEHFLVFNISFNMDDIMPTVFRKKNQE
jgi:hypothetical protein